MSLVVSSLVIKVTVRNPILPDLEISVPFLVDGGCEVVPVLLHHRDVSALQLQLSQSGKVAVLMGDHFTTSNITLLQPVEVTLFFSDSTSVSATMAAGFFSPLHDEASLPTVVVVAEDERILGHDALKILGLKQDFKSHCLIKAPRRL